MQRSFSLKIKRILDLSGAVFLLLVFSPLFLLTALLVYLNLGKPVFFLHPRIGYKGKTFMAYKFRSMRHLCDASGKLLPDGCRMTLFSRILRASSLDEIPQLLNVLKGEMSLIGPRPMLVEYLPYLKEHEYRRLDMLPGISGLAQISGRNLIGWDERFALDIHYVDHWSLTMDFVIAVKTFPVWIMAQGISTPGYATAPRLDEERRDQIMPLTTDLHAHTEVKFDQAGSDTASNEKLSSVSLSPEIRASLFPNLKPRALSVSESALQDG